VADRASSVAKAGEQRRDKGWKAHKATCGLKVEEGRNHGGDIVRLLIRRSHPLAPLAEWDAGRGTRNTPLSLYIHHHLGPDNILTLLQSSTDTVTCKDYTALATLVSSDARTLRYLCLSPA
jgi:hypothetical protein